MWVLNNNNNNNNNNSKHDDSNNDNANTNDVDKKKKKKTLSIEQAFSSQKLIPTPKRKETNTTSEDIQRQLVITKTKET